MSRLLTGLLGLWLCVPVWSTSTVAENSAALDLEPYWIAHPSAPGPDVPPAGRSLFDQLFASYAAGELTYHVPYPFEALRASLAARLEQGESTPLLQVLIPHGRSLHREAAAPDYFKSPRVVLTIEAQPLTLENEAGLALSRKFYIGYQPRAEQLEIISYNNDAGRFEFQVVSDYAAGKTPSVRYASRALCMSCHQNAGPIFAATPWRETNFDTNIAMRLAKEQPERYRTTMAALSGHDAALIDYSTDRANYFSPYQLLWQEACGGQTPDDEASVRCRAGVLKAMLQYRLTHDIAYDHTDFRYANNTLSAFYDNWRARWPAGLYVATADIPDRDPREPTPGNSVLDPLVQREPQAFWPEPIDMVASGMVTRLSEFIIDADIQRYDSYLKRVSRASARNSFDSVCEIQPGSPRLTGAPIKFVCGDSQSVQAYIELVIQDDQVVGGHIFELHLPGNTFLWSANMAETTLTKTSGRNILNASLARAGQISTRLADGRRLESIVLRWLGENYSVDLIGGEASVTVTLVDEFAPLDDAIEAMARETLAGKSDALAAKPFRRQPIVSDLNRHLGLAELDWCCDLPPVSSNQAYAPARIESDSLQPFQDYCGRCHSSSGHYPPGFLHGAEPDIKRHLAECAPRILHRLALWGEHSQSRARSPMPPASALALIGHNESSWLASETLSNLTDTTRVLLAEVLGQQVSETALDVDYDTLPPCTPQ